MAKVSRSSATKENINKLRFHRIKVYLQLFPGTFANEENRAMSVDIEFRLYINGKYAQSGNIAADGSATVLIPSGNKAELDVLGTMYALTPTANLAPFDSLKGIQQRLRLLGYFHREADEKWDADFDRAVQNFQADHGLHSDGIATHEATYHKIKSEFGE
ncbi:MAG: hypothetical protein ACI92O_000399 [Colwellia sp.]|jgi:hypothetical protein